MKNNNGFGLIEAMIALGVMTVVALGTAQVMYNGLLANQTNDSKTSMVALDGSLSQIALNQTSCTMAITKTVQNFGTAVRFDLPDGTVVSQGASVTNYNLNVNQFNFVNPALVAVGTDGSKVYFGTLQLGFTATQKVLGPSTFATRSIASIYLTVDVGNKITACGANMPTLVSAPVPPPPAVNPTPAPTPSSAQLQACLSSGGNYNNGTCSYPAPKPSQEIEQNQEQYGQHDQSTGRATTVVDGCLRNVGE